VRVAERASEHVLAHEAQQLLERPPLLGQRLVEEARGGPDLAEHRAIDEPGAVVGHGVGGQTPDPPDFLGREIELAHIARTLRGTKRRL